MSLVTAVCPTANRLKYIPRAIQCFLSQTFKDSELVILDDGAEPCYPVVPIHPRIRYEYGQPGCWKTTGAKRNAINAMANGDIIWHMDDDDWSAPERMEEQVALLTTGSARVVGYHTLLYYRESDCGLFKYRYSGMGDYAIGTSQCYWREYWKANPFPELNIGEDSQFSFKAAAKNMLASTPGCGMIVARTLSSSTAKPALGSCDFPKAEKSEFPKAFFDAEQE